MDDQELSRLIQLSPFEVKNTLIAQASSHPDLMMLNAGRGNPNQVAVDQAFKHPGCSLATHQDFVNRYTSKLNPQTVLKQVPF